MKVGPYKLLIVETNTSKKLNRNTQELHWENQFQVDSFNDLQQAALSAERHSYDGVIIGVDLLDPANNKLLSRALYLFARLPIIILSSVESPLIEQRFVQLGFQDFLVDGQYEISQLCRSIICAIERKRLLQSYQTNPILEGRLNTPQRTETLIADLMATLQPSVSELGSAIDRLNGAEATPAVDSKSYFPLIRRSRENLEKKYIRFFHVQQSLKAIDKAIQPFSLTPTADLVMRSFSSTLDFLKAKTQLKISCHQWYGSYEAFCEILYQLISNAIKFRSNRRQLQLQISMRKLSNGDLKLTVADNGLGIDLRYDKGKVFQLFYQEHYRDTRSSDGTGLYIVKTLVNFYRGTVSINSRVNQGSIISIHLPDHFKR